MPEFYYEALDKGGKTVKGVIDAGSEDVIIEKLRGMGYYPLKINRHKKKTTEMDLFSLPGIRHIAHRITNKQIMTFSRQLATLIDAGLPILRSLQILQEQVESVIFKDKIGQIAHDIESGSSLSEAFAKHPKVFSKLYVNMVRAGEIGGVLEAVLNKIAEFLESRQVLIGKVRSAMMYPIVVMLVAGTLVTFILTTIMPKFDEIYAQLGAELPGLTQTLIDISRVLTDPKKVPFVIAGVILLIIAIVRLNKTKSGRYAFDVLKLKMPVFGELIRKLAITRFADTFATLITSGVPILQALDIVRDTSGNEVISRAMEKVYASVKEGDTVHEPLRECKVFPPLVIHMVAVGEETGAIDQMLQKVAEAYQREVDNTVDALTSIIEPLLIVMLGAIIGVIVVALYLPLFNIAKVVK